MGVNLLRPFIGQDNQAHFTSVPSSFPVPIERKPKKRSRPSKAKRLKATATFKAQIAENKANMKAIRAETHAAIGETGGRKFSTGFRTSADMKQGYVFRGASNMGRMNNAGHDTGFTKPI